MPSKPSVITFWQMPSDEGEFFGYLSKKTVNVYPLGNRAAAEKLAPIDLDTYIQQGDRKPCLFGLKSQSQEVVIEASVQEGRRIFYISDMLSSVVAYQPGLLTSTALGTTNVAAYWETQRGERWVGKSDEFCKWGKAIFRWLRKRVNPWTGEYPFERTDAVVEAVQRGLDLVDQ